MTTPRPLPAAVRTFAESTLRLASVMHEAEAVQWSPSLTPKPREDTTERAKGGHGDPVVSTVLDPRRLAVRAAVIDAELALKEAEEKAVEARRALEAALARWQG